MCHFTKSQCENMFYKNSLKFSLIRFSIFSCEIYFKRSFMRTFLFTFLSIYLHFSHIFTSSCIDSGMHISYKSVFLCLLLFFKPRLVKPWRNLKITKTFLLNFPIEVHMYNRIRKSWNNKMRSEIPLMIVFTWLAGPHFLLLNRPGYLCNG